LQDLLVDLDKDPKYKKDQYKSITMGITGVVAFVVAVALCFTPLISTAPIVAQYAVHLVAVGGALGVTGGFAMYHGFGRTLMDSSIKQAIEEYLEHKLEQVEKYKQPVTDHDAQAKALQDLINSEFPGGVSVETLAQFVDSFNILCSTYKGEEPQSSLAARVCRFFATRGPYISAISGATALSVGAITMGSTIYSEDA
jgi:hypothetical protein